MLAPFVSETGSCLSVSQWVKKDEIGAALLCPEADELREKLVVTYGSRRVAQQCLGLIKVKYTN